MHIRHNSKLKTTKILSYKIRKKRRFWRLYFYKRWRRIRRKTKYFKSNFSIINVYESKKAESEYENLFYVLETNITNLSNENFLNEYDFYDIPGHNEYIKNDESAPSFITTMNEENIESKENQIEKCDENMTYIRGIFQYI